MGFKEKKHRSRTGLKISAFNALLGLLTATTYSGWVI
jgi:hypothetical protein